MHKHTLWLLPIASVLMAAAPANSITERMREQIVAQARSLDPARLTFERTTNMERVGGGSRTKTIKVERWDGKSWTLASLNGKVPTASEKREAEKQAAAMPVPGYHRLASLLAATTETSIDAQGRTVLHIPVLPTGAVQTDAKDISSHLSATATLGMKDGKAWVQTLAVKAREPFKLNFLIKVTSFEQTNEYKLDASGQPRLMAQANDSIGTMFGYSGGQKSEVVYAYR
jgi:hypothetical protein